MKNGTLKDVAFYYTSIAKPKNKFQSQEKEFAVDIVLSKADATKFAKEYPKKKYKLVQNDEFMDLYKTDVPFPEQPIQYVIKFSRDELRKDGTPIPDANKPRVYLEDRSGQIFDITDEYLVGNGSRGDLNFFVIETTDFGDHPKLSNILVKKLVKFESNNTGNVNLAAVAKKLDNTASLDADIVGSEEKPASTEPTTKKSKPTTTVQDDQLPF